MNTIQLKNGVEIPAVGFGTFKAGETDGVTVVSEAIQAGYRHFDTASAYGTEEAVGAAIKAAQLTRNEFFVTTKAWKTELGYDNVLRAFDQSLQRLDMDYVDLYLLHWPLPQAGYQDWKSLDRDSWRAVEHLYEQGRVRAIGVSNYLPHHLENILTSCHVAPMVDQIEFHPGYTQWDTVRCCQQQGIVVEGWSPLGRQRIAQEPLLLELAQHYGVSHAQLCLKFAIQCGVIPLPKSANPQRMLQNLQLDFELAQADVERILAMPESGFSGLHPDL